MPSNNISNENKRPRYRIISNKFKAHANAADIEALKSLYKISLETRNFEISQLLQRNNFFMLFQGVLLAGFVQSSHSKPVVSFLISFAGLMVSFFQTRMASGAKFWQEYWEAALHKVEDILVDELKANGRTKLFKLFHEDQSTYEKMVKERLHKQFNITTPLILKKYSVSRTPIYVGVWLTIIWLLLTLCTMRGYPPLHIPSFIVGF